MVLARWCAVALACAVAACAPGLGQSNSAKMGEALAFAAAAGVAQVAESVAEQNARNNAPVTHSQGMVSQGCDNEGQYPCVTVAPSSAPGAPPEDFTDEEARDYVLGYVNGVRKIAGVSRLERDGLMDEFAQDGSDELSRDHHLGKHLTDHAQELHARSAEVQGSPDGARPGPLQEQLAQMLLGMMGEGPGGMHHDVLLRPEWRKLGVGILNRAGRLYFTVDFAS